MYSAFIILAKTNHGTLWHTKIISSIYKDQQNISPNRTGPPKHGHI